MQSTGHDPNFALHASSGLPGHVLDVVVLTADAGLLATLREASGAEHAIWHAQSADTAVDLLVGGRCGILIADLGALRGDAAAFFDRLHAQFPELVLMATGRRDEEGGVATLVSSGLIYRLLHKPVSPARAGLFIAAATRRYQELRNLEPIGMATIRTMAARPNLGKLIAAAAALVVAIVAFVVWRSANQTDVIAAPPTAMSPATPAEQIATLLGRAQIAYARDQLSEPRGDNALEHYRAVLAAAPDHAEARAGLARVIEALEARVVAALQARNAPQGLRALAALQDAQPDHPRLDALRAELIEVSRSAAVSPAPQRAQALQPTADPGTSAATPASDHPPQAQPLDEPIALPSEDRTAPFEPSPSAEAFDAPAAAHAKALQDVARLRERGALLAPEDANAYDALAALRAEFPGAEEVRAEEQRLAFALLEEARTALAARSFDDAATFLEHAESLVPGMATTRTLQQQLTAAQQERAFAANVVQAATLTRVREVGAVYPRDAERDGVEGWVDVEFTIAPDGSTQDLVVRDALHREVFEKAALDSVRRWRFAPVLRNGQGVAQRAVLRVRFVLQ